MTSIGLHEHEPGRAWVETYDPTLLSRRLLTQFELEDYDGGDVSAKWLWNLRWAVQIEKDLALGIQLETPLRWADVSGEEETGFGDLEARIGMVRRLHPAFRLGVSVNAKFPTASDELLGDGLIELRPIIGVRWDAIDWLQLGANLEYSFTPRDEGDDDVSATELKFPAVVKLADKLSLFTSYNPRWNHAKATDRHRLELGLTRLFGSRNDYALSVGGEVPLTSETFDWKGSLGFTWFF